MKPKSTMTLAALALATGLSATLAQTQSQGVSKTEITLGSIQDLSGPLASAGKQARLGMMLRVDEINEQGGINGRMKLRRGTRLATVSSFQWARNGRSPLYPSIV